MRYTRRKDAPRVRDGVTQFKNNWTATKHWSQASMDRYVVDRERPGAGYRHVLRQSDVDRFVEILPEWEELSKGVDVLLLARGEDDAYGWYQHGIVAVCAWTRDLGQAWSQSYVEEHRFVLDRLGINEHPVDEDGYIQLDFTEASVKGFQLMHVLLHELGHHHDRMTSRGQKKCGRGEGYADAYAKRHAEQLWDRYHREFDW